MNVDKPMKRLKDVDAGKYGTAFGEMTSVLDNCSGPDEVFMLAFNSGFLRSQQAVKAEARREKKRRMERDTSGWYAYLLRWLERNIDNERLLHMVGVHARNVENIMKEAALND